MLAMNVREINRQFQVRGAAAENGSAADISSYLDTGNYLDI